MTFQPGLVGENDGSWSLPRPRSLLCLALRREHVTTKQVSLLENNDNGWKNVTV